jgi:hypothetical protein
MKKGAHHTWKKSTLHYFLVGSASGFASMFAPSTTSSI